MHRRRFLTTAGTGIVTIAGCVGIDAPANAGGGTADLTERADAQFRGGLRRQGYHPEATVPDDVAVDWSVPGVNTGEHTAAKASPVPAPTGDVIVPGDTGVLHAVTPEGRVRWRARTDHSVRGIHGTPAIANGVVYIGAYDGAMYAFDLDTGDRLWRSDLGDAIGSSPAYHDGSLYIPVEYDTPSGSVFALDAATGAVEWEDQRPDDHPHSTPAIDLDAGNLVFGSNDGRLYAWDYPALEFAWAFDTGKPIKGPVATHDGAAFVGSWDHGVYRIDLATGEEEWRFEADGRVMSGPGVDPDRGTVYVGSHDTRLYALDAATGAERWSFDTHGLLIGCPTGTREHVLVGSYDTRLYAVGKEDGEEAWNVPNDGWVTSTPLVHDGRIYYTERATEDRDGGAYALSAKT